ncbi:CatB-related O-acetyltransferase [Roseibium sp. CAU 1637]|uniref:CatB-related O-acetyltransferase n=1 Tax=Roseibium limicola TaxID=2816037 RepID=A0A939EMZ6_9HYPH|nr:CatB-related O-acetyltransferase [Roseibium limicola]MBO0345715.1 CatB-related O-acetyltransferase [Roseibium limicola]
MHGPAPEARFPFPGAEHTVFIKNVISGDYIEAGDYSYYNDPVDAARFQEKCVRYHFDFLGDRLTIGKFCALATGVEFIMNGANHAMGGVSTYPFHIFQGGWEQDYDTSVFLKNSRGDTTVGHDVWIGTDATILPGVSIGSGAIVGSKSVVGSDVPPYAIVAGNPARIIRTRFDAATVDRLLEIAWWNWPIEMISANLSAIREGHPGDLECIAAAL